MSIQSEIIKISDWGIGLSFEETRVENVPDCISSLKKAIYSCIELNKSRILMDVTHYESYHFSAVGIIDIIRLIKKENLNIKIAIISDHPLSKDNFSFFETITLSQLVPLRYFDESEKALDWLLLNDNKL